MKKMLIILMALVAFVSITAFGSEPTDDNAPLPTEEDIFLSDLSQLSEEELMEIFGNYIVSAALNNDTDQCTDNDMKIRQIQQELLDERLEKGKKYFLIALAQSLFNGSVATASVFLGAILSQLNTLIQSGQTLTIATIGAAIAAAAPEIGIAISAGVVTAVATMIYYYVFD